MRMDDLLTFTDAGNRLGVSRGRVGQLARQGRLALVRLDARTPRVTAASVEQFSRQRRKAGRPRKAPLP